MRVYLQPPQPSRGLQRIADALRRYAPPSVEVLSFPRNADLTVIYAIGRRDAIQRQVADILSRGKKYAIVQVCLRSTMNPCTFDWVELWYGATCVWSYYDLLAAVDDDAFGDQFYAVERFKMDVNFYHAPLGVDGEVFTADHDLSYRRRRGEYVIATSGSSRLSESVRECHLAAEAVGCGGFHLGPQLRLAGFPICGEGFSGKELAIIYTACEFVSGLRRKEGFELPAAEGLLCGARPIVFNTPDYHWNYKHWAEYIEETDRQGVVDQLVQLFRQGARPVTAHEREEAAHWFNWERVCGEFWQRCL